MRTHKHITSVTAGSMRAGPNFSWRFSRGKMMLTILGGLAEFERSLILARTADGVKRAKDRGVKFGRPPALTTYQRQEARQRLEAGESQSDIARTFGVSQATISRLVPSPFEVSVAA